MKITQTTKHFTVVILILMIPLLLCTSCLADTPYITKSILPRETDIQTTTMTPVSDLVKENSVLPGTLIPTPIVSIFNITREGDTSILLPLASRTPIIDVNQHWLAFGIPDNGESCEHGLKCYKSNIAICELNMNNNKPCSTLFPNYYSWSVDFFQFSPDGKYFAVSTKDTDSTWIYETKNWQQIVEVDKTKIRPDIAWAHDSQGIAVQFDEAGNVLYYLRLDGTKTPLLTMDDVFPEGFPPIMPGVVEWGPTWSPDSKQIAYIKYYPDHDELWVKDVVNGKNKMLYKGMGPLGVNPKWSPSGRYISMYGNGLQVFDLQSNTLQTFLKSPYSIYQDYLDEDYVWSPQGNQIAVKLTYDDTDKTGLYVMNVDTKKLDFIKNGEISPIQWLANGSLVFTQFDTNSNYILGWMEVKD